MREKEDLFEVSSDPEPFVIFSSFFCVVVSLDDFLPFMQARASSFGVSYYVVKR